MKHVTRLTKLLRIKTYLEKEGVTHEQLRQMIHEVRYYIRCKEEFNVYVYVYNEGNKYLDEGFRYKLITVYSTDIFSGGNVFVRVEYASTIPFSV
jgi:hypothetical protein